MSLECPTSACISPITIKPEMKIKTLSNQDLARIHQATLAVLNETGVRFPCEKALNIFAEAGAQVDFKSQTVKIQPDLLMESLAHAPRHFTMGSRGDRDLDVVLDGHKTYGGTAGTGTQTIDRATGRRRPSTKSDIAMMALISDYLPSISFYWPMVAAQDCPVKSIALHELEASFANTQKHVQIVSCVNQKSATYAIEMAKTIAGSSEQLKTRPPLSLIASPISPLANDQGVIDAALVFAEAGLPVGFASMPVLGSTAPASIAGTMVLGNAEILSSVCLLQLINPGTPLFYPLFSAMMNPFTGRILVSTHIQHLFYAGTVQLGHYYNLPVMSSFGGSDLQHPQNWSVGKSDAIDAFFVCAAGADMLPSFGLLEAYTLLHPDKLLFDDDIFQAVKTMSEGLCINSDTLAVEEIMAVGSGGHFLDREFTLNNLRQLWQPGIIQDWSAENQDFRDPLESAARKTRWIIDNHQPRPLDANAATELKRIIRSAEGELPS